MRAPLRYSANSDMRCLWLKTGSGTANMSNRPLTLAASVLGASMAIPAGEPRPCDIAAPLTERSANEVRRLTCPAAPLCRAPQTL